jgi:heat shock protein HslJ
MIRVPAHRILLIGALLTVVALSPTGCATSSRDDSALLAGNKWQATQIRTDKGLVPAPGAGGPSTEFADGKVSGSTGVNQYNGQYTTQADNKIEITVGPMTLMAGPPAAMALEQSFITALKSAKRYSVTETTLTLQDEVGEVLVSYKILKATPLVGTEWDCTMYNNGRGGVQSLVASSAITAVFGADDSLTGNAGVNKCNGTYVADKGTIKIDAAIASTMMAGDPEIMAQEAAYLAALPKATTYEIDGSTLTLRDSTGAAMAGYQAK